MTRIYMGSFQPQFRSSLTVDMDVAGKGDGIYAYEWDEEQGELSLCGNTYAVINPARLCYSELCGRIYVASDTNEFLNWEAGTGGGVYAFDVLEDGTLKYVDSRSSCGVRAVDIRCDATGKYVLCINEGSDFCTTEFIRNEQGRYVANIRRDEGCMVLLRTDEKGFSKVCDRYVLPEGAPAHPICMHLDAENYVYIANGSGKAVDILYLDTENEKLLPVTTVALSVAPKGLAFHPTLPVFFASCPGEGEISILRFDRAQRKALLVQTVFEEEESFPGVLAISRDGQTLYSADTRLCEIKVYGISQEGKLVLIQRAAEEMAGIQAHSIYDMQLTPSGKWLLCSSMHGDAVLAFPVANDGRLGQVKRFPALTPTGLLMVSRLTFPTKLE